jgi:GTP-binding protein Era
MEKKAAFVAVVGRPSVGKSTLVNKLCGEKVAIVSTVPQTTRNAIRGIVNREQGQLVFVDTPGRHKSEKKFNKKLTEVSGRAVADSDIVLYVVDAVRAPGPEEVDIVSLLIPYVERTVIAINKIDADGAAPGRIWEFLGENLPDIDENRLFKISAINGEGVERLLSALYDISPEGEPLYGEEYYTDQDVNFRIAEIIREQAINRLREELPHALYVDVADAQFTDPKAALSDDNYQLPTTNHQLTLWVRAFIIVERESQKGMVVGKGGTMIRDIRLAALKELRKIFDWKIELDLRVKTGKDWRHNDRVLNKLVSG